MQIAHTNAPKILAESTQQRNFDHIFVSILINDEPRELDFQVDRKAACLQSRREIHTEVLSKAGGDVRTFLMGLAVNLPWSSVCDKIQIPLKSTILLPV